MINFFPWAEPLPALWGPKRISRHTDSALYHTLFQVVPLFVACLKMEIWYVLRLSFYTFPRVIYRKTSFFVSLSVAFFILRGSEVLLTLRIGPDRFVPKASVSRLDFSSHLFSFQLHPNCDFLSFLRKFPLFTNQSISPLSFFYSHALALIAMLSWIPPPLIRPIPLVCLINVYLKFALFTSTYSWILRFLNYSSWLLKCLHNKVEACLHSEHRTMTYYFYFLSLVYLSFLKCWKIFPHFASLFLTPEYLSSILVDTPTPLHLFSPSGCRHTAIWSGSAGASSSTSRGGWSVRNRPLLGRSEHWLTGLLNAWNPGKWRWFLFPSHHFHVISAPCVPILRLTEQVSGWKHTGNFFSSIAANMIKISYGHLDIFPRLKSTTKCHRNEALNVLHFRLQNKRSKLILHCITLVTQSVSPSCPTWEIWEVPFCPLRSSKHSRLTGGCFLYVTQRHSTQWEDIIDRTINHINNVWNKCMTLKSWGFKAPDFVLLFSSVRCSWPPDISDPPQRKHVRPLFWAIVCAEVREAPAAGCPSRLELRPSDPFGIRGLLKGFGCLLPRLSLFWGRGIQFLLTAG